MNKEKWQNPELQDEEIKMVFEQMKELSSFLTSTEQTMEMKSYINKIESLFRLPAVEHKEEEEDQESKHERPFDDLTPEQVIGIAKLTAENISLRRELARERAIINSFNALINRR